MNRPFTLGLATLCGLGLIAIDRRGTQPHGRTVRRVVRASAQRPPPPATLIGLCGGSDTVVVGQVTGIFWVSRIPVNCPTSPLICTVYNVAVEQYLQFDGAPQMPPTLKILVHGGIDEYGTALVLDDEPWLNVGDRYILFLDSEKYGDRIGMADGVWGVVSYADEYVVSDILRGKLILAGGITAVPSDPYQTPSLWEWEVGGGTLLGLTQEDAIAQIRQGITEAAILRAAEEAEATQLGPE